MPEIIIVAGPNGAGKTSFARQYLARPDKARQFINADEIARELPEAISPQTRRDIEAARFMLARIESLASAGQGFAIETTLSALTYVDKIKTWKQQGYRVVLIFLRLPVPITRSSASAAGLTKGWNIWNGTTSTLLTSGTFGIA